MKTLEEIVNRTDYEHLNNALRDRSCELAEKLLEGCKNAGLHHYEEFRLAGITFEVRHIRANSGFSDDFLYMQFEDGEQYELTMSSSRYYAGDFNHYIKAAHGAVRLYFLNNAKKIFEALDEFINQDCKDIEMALKDVENL